MNCSRMRSRDLTWSTKRCQSEMPESLDGLCQAFRQRGKGKVGRGHFEVVKGLGGTSIDANRASTVWDPPFREI